MNTRAAAVHDLELRLGYSFKDRTLLERALTHASVGEGAKKAHDNEVMEFLGDRVLGLMVAEALIERHPESSEGELAPRLNGLVSRETCARIARNLDVGPALRMSGSATKTGVRDKGSVLAGATEALIAAVYMDAGLEAVRKVFLPLWREAFGDYGADRRRDAKTGLQEWAQGQGKPLPTYEITSRSGPDHAPTFVVTVTVEGYTPAQASGQSRQEAEKAAARLLLDRENPS
jgi:ribonuclease-3